MKEAIMRSAKTEIILTVVFTLMMFGLAFNTEAAVKFYQDDPIWVDPDVHDASGIKGWQTDVIYDAMENLFTNPGDKAQNVRAQNINTIDEVPDSNWYTNRAGKITITPGMIEKGPNTGNGPAPGTWTVISSKSDGVTPGFTIKDSTGQKWFLKFDPPQYRDMATGTEVAVTKLLWALGYYVPENYISTFHREDLVIGEGATFKPLNRNKRKMTEGDLNSLLKKVAKNEDGSYRVTASKALSGVALSGFRFYGTFPEDPNDVVPHEHRRELRGYRVFAAWLNHVDSRSMNSMDALIEQNGIQVVRHHLLDFGSTLGSGAVGPRNYWDGSEYLYEGSSQILKGMASFGFYILPWQTDNYYKSSSVGRLKLDSTNWDPDKWKPEIPNAAFKRARQDDKFWAARKLITLSDETIRAAVQTGEFRDEEASVFLTNALVQRRDAIGRKYLTAINPVIDPVLDPSGVLTFGNAAVSAGFAQAPESYSAKWYIFNNETGESTPIGETTSSAEQIKAPGKLPTEHEYLKVEISSVSKEYPSWQTPVSAYFARNSTTWKLVGLERMQ
jgi:hypothetical protein